MMIPTRLCIEPNQEKRIMKAIRKLKNCRIKVKKGKSHEMLLTPAQWTRYQATPDGKVIHIPFEHKHLVDNHKGGFLPLIAAALAPVLGGVAGGLIEREIAGSGIRKKKKTGKGMYLNPYRGKGLYLSPYKK